MCICQWGKLLERVITPSLVRTSGHLGRRDTAFMFSTTLKVRSKELDLHPLFPSPIFLLPYITPVWIQTIFPMQEREKKYHISKYPPKENKISAVTKVKYYLWEGKLAGALWNRLIATPDCCSRCSSTQKVFTTPSSHKRGMKEAEWKHPRVTKQVVRKETSLFQVN